MNRMVVRYGRISAFLLALVVSGVAACSENFESTATCSDATGLCPNKVPALKEALLYPVVLDTTVGTYPPIGQEVGLTLAARGDSLDTRAVIRFDSLPTKYRVPKADSDSVIRGVKNSSVLLRLNSAHMRPAAPTAPVRIDLYDVYAPGVDTVTSDLLALFTPSHLLATRLVPPDSLSDSVRIALPDDSVFAHLHSGTPLRIGIRVSSSESIQLEVRPLNAGYGDPLTFLPLSPDTTQTATTVLQNSHTAGFPDYLNSALADFMIVARSMPAASNFLLETGGVPGRRAYLRFDLPDSIVDSVDVVRAVLELTQRPNRSSPSAYEKDTLGIVPVLASYRVTDLYRAISLTGTVSSDSLSMAPADSGLRSFEIVRILHSWHTQRDTLAPRAVVIHAQGEGTKAGVIQFYSTSADISVRPRLRITYLPRVGFALP